MLPCKSKMGKRKIEIKKIEKKSSRHVCFSKRRQGLFKKAAELSILCGVDLSVLVFSPAGKLFSFANPNVDSVIDRYLGKNPTRHEPDPDPLLLTRLAQLEDRCRSAHAVRGEFWWDQVNVEEIWDKEQLLTLLRSLEEVGGKVLARVNEMSLASSSSSVLPLTCEGLAPFPPSFDFFPYGDDAMGAEMEEEEALSVEFLPEMYVEPCLDVGFGADEVKLISEAGNDDVIFDMLPPLDDLGNYFF